MEVDTSVSHGSGTSLQKSIVDSTITVPDLATRSEITTQFPDSSSFTNVRSTEPVLTSNIVTQLSEISGSMITSMSNNELNVSNNIPSHGSIIITNNAIVFPPGTLMLTREKNCGNLDGQQSNQVEEDRDDDSKNDNDEYDIKVETVENNAYKSNIATYKIEQTHSSTNSTFNMNQNVLQSVSDPVRSMQQIAFNDESHINQFHIQMPLSMDDMQNLQKINHSVFMSQTALPEDTKSLGEENVMIDHTVEDMSVENNIVDHTGENIIVDGDVQDVIADGDVKHKFVASCSVINGGNNSSETIVLEEDNSIIVSGDNEYLPPDDSFNADQHGNLFIKNENTHTPGNVLQGEEVVEGRVKSDSRASSTSENQLVTNHPYQQVMYVHVNTRKPSGNQVFPIMSDSMNQNIQISLNSDDTAESFGQKSIVVRKKRAGRKSAKKAPYQTEKSGLRTLAPRLLSFPLYAGAQAAVGIGKSLLKPINLGALQIIEGGQYFEVLGRCTQCFRFSRTTTYCRAEKNHRDPKSSVCIECEALGLSTVVCRRKLNHSAPNAQPLNIVINTALQNKEHVKQLCVRNNLPSCFCELHSIVVHHADITFVGNRRFNMKFEMKSDMKYDIQEFSNTALLSTTGLVRSENVEYGNGDISTTVLPRTCNGEFGNSLLHTADLTEKGNVELVHDSNMLTNSGTPQKQNQGKPYTIKSELKYDVNEFDYNEFVPIPRVTRKPTDYARGYLYPYTKEKWTQWLLKFCYQTCTNFRIRTGKRVNKKLDHGLANHNGRIVPYRTLETQLYNCALGGRPRKRKVKDGVKKRKERGSKLIGCPAVIHTRLLETEYDWCALEVTAPKLLAHLPFHDPRHNNADVLLEYEDVLLAQTNPSQMSNNEEEATDEQKFDFIHEVVSENENLNDNEKILLDVKKNTKSLLLTCASLTEMIDSDSVMLSIQEQSHDLLNRMHKEAMSNKQTTLNKANRKKLLTEQEEEDEDENVVIGKEKVVSTNLEQIEHIGMINMMN